MASPIHHGLLAFALVGSLFAACGGRTADVIGGASSSAASSGGSGGSSGGSSSGGVTGSSSGGVTGSSSGFSGTSSGGTSGAPPGCTFIDAASFDQTCNQAADCFPIADGTICAGSCFCPGEAAINVSNKAQYEAEIGPFATCIPSNCPPGPPVACIGNRCCTGGPTDPPECMAGPPPLVCMQGPGSGSSGGDAGVCSLQASESCSDGTTYSAYCTCPDAICTCTQASRNGGSSSGGNPFKGCAEGCDPSSVRLAYEACGFPVLP